MQAIVDAIRGTGSTHIILLGGVQYSNALTQWLAHKPTDPLGQLGAAWHLYNFNACISPTCWDVAPAAVAAAVPLVASEIGQNDCMGAFIMPLMQWLDAPRRRLSGLVMERVRRLHARRAQGRAAAVVAHHELTTGAPNGGYAQAFHDHVAAK